LKFDFLSPFGFFWRLTGMKDELVREEFMDIYGKLGR
jgi:hypothetical protein